MPLTSYYIRTLAGGAVEITHAASRTTICVCANALIASKVVAVLCVAELDAPIVWNVPVRDVLGLGGLRPQGDRGAAS